jgi:hypothetical protein
VEGRTLRHLIAASHTRNWPAALYHLY